MNTDLENFIKEYMQEPLLQLDSDIIIEDDLGISGDDAYDFIVLFSKQFGVNISNFKFDKYFYSEPSLFLSWKKRTPLTLGLLEEAIKEKTLK